MITKFKIYEGIYIGEPQIGEYVNIFWGYRVNSYNNYASTNNIDKRDMLMSYIENNVGKIIDFFEYDNTYLVLYDENLPRDIKTIHINATYIRYWSKKKEEVETYLSEKKIQFIK